LKRSLSPLTLAVLGLILFSFFPRTGHALAAGAIPSTTEYWTLSDAAYHISTSLENSGTYVPPQGYTLIKVSTTAQLSFGFAAAALRNPKNGYVIIANEGTLPGVDVYGRNSLAADLVIAHEQTPTALTYAQEFAQQVEKKLGGKTPIFVTGHSLGGIEAEAEEYILFASSTPTNAVGGKTFGATGLPGQTTSGGPPNLVNYVDYGDPIGNDASDTGTQTPDPFAPPTPMYHYGTVVMVGPLTNAQGLEKASYLSTASADIDSISQYETFGGASSDDYWLAAISLAAMGIHYHLIANYAADLGISPGSTAFVPLDSLDEAVYALGAPLWKGDESNLGNGTISNNGTLTTPDFVGSYNSSTDQFTISQIANIKDVSGTIVKGGTNTLTLDPTTDSITQETYASPDGTTYTATLNPTMQEFQTLEANEANGASYQIQYTYTNADGLSSTVTNGYTSSNLSGTLLFTQTTSYDANEVATSATINGTDDIATLDNAAITIASNSTATAEGNTINGSGNTISMGTNDNITVAAAKGESSFTDTVNAASTVDFTTDTITFEGHFIAGNIPANGIDKYGRVYAVNGKTVTISKGSDSLTISGFVNGDFGVNFGYTYMTVDVSGTNLSEIWGINDSGQLAGVYYSPVTTVSFTGTSGNLVPLTNAYVRDCPPPNTNSYLFADAINNTGVIVGDYWSCTAGGYVGAIYSNGAITSVTAPSWTFLNSINDAGQIVGEYGSPSGYPSGFLYSSGVLTNFDYPNSVGTSLVGINNSGTIVGNYFTSQDPNPPTGVGHGFVYSKGTFTAINVPGSDKGSTVVIGINNLGQILGSYTRGGNTYYYLDTGGRFLTLNFSIPQAISNTTTIAGLNDSGQIVGMYSSSGMTNGFIATPIAATAPNA
jgi:hypothetical protein